MSSMEGAVHIKVATGDTYSKYNITLAETEIAQISIALKDSFKAEMATLVKGIVDWVLTGLNERMQSIEKENTSLKKENADQKLESAAEFAEQHSKRNRLRVSGIDETVRKNTVFWKWLEI